MECTCGHEHEDETAACSNTDCDCTAFTAATEPASADPEPAGDELGSKTIAEFMAEHSLTAEQFAARFAEAPTPAPEIEDDDEYEPFEMPIMVVEGAETGDGRFIDPGALTWRDLPQPVMGILKTTFGHQEAELVGRLDSIERIDVSEQINPRTGQPFGDGVSALVGKGVFAKRPQSDEMSDLIRGEFIRGVSVDLGDVESVFEMVDEDGNVVEDENPFLDLFWFTEDGKAFAKKTAADDDEEDEPKYHFRERMTAARQMGITICPFPAFESAYIKLADGTTTPQATPALVASVGQTMPSIRVLDDPTARECKTCETEDGVVVASVGAGPMYPPAAWFDMEEPDELTPMTITDDGRIFGHAAGWQTCHTGVNGRCLLATKSRTNYANFMKGAIRTAEGDDIAVGVITMSTGHADLQLNSQAALAHYDNTGTVAASVTARDGKHGIWVCGALEPDISELQIRKLRGSALSGDWRPHGRANEMIAVLAVNTPGFLVPRSQTASGRVTALVAAGVVQGQVAEEKRRDPALQEFMEYVLRKDAAELRDRVAVHHAASLERTASQLRSRVHGS